MVDTSPISLESKTFKLTTDLDVKMDLLSTISGMMPESPLSPVGKEMLFFIKCSLAIFKNLSNFMDLLCINIYKFVDVTGEIKWTYHSTHNTL